MARHLVAVPDHTDPLDNAAAIRAARQAASAPEALSERREAIADAVARAHAGERLTKILEDVALGMYLTGYLEHAAATRRHLDETDLAFSLLAEEQRLLLRRPPTHRAGA